MKRGGYFITVFQFYLCSLELCFFLESNCILICPPLLCRSPPRQGSLTPMSVRATSGTWLHYLIRLCRTT